MQATKNYLQERRKMALLLPVIVVPCLVFAFYGLRGGRGSAGATATGLVRGVNMSLPAAQLDAKKTPDKLQLYEKAAIDSEKRVEQLKQDPYAAGRWREDSDRLTRGSMDSIRRLGWGGPAAPGWRGGQMGGDQRQRSIDATTDAVMARVAELKKLINGQAGSGSSGAGVAGASGWTPRSTGGRADAAMQGTSGAGRDPEMERIDAMLDKLIRIQHPDLVGRDTSGAGKTAGPVFVLSVPRQEETVQALGGGASGGEVSGFMEIGEGDHADSLRRVGEAALEATIDGDQTVMNGAWVALRLSRGADLGGLELPAGQLLTGEASISGERLKIHIGAIRVGASILPVDIQVYDLDGVAGIRVPGAMTRDVSKESAAEAMSGLGLASMDPSLAEQAANAGLQLARSLTGRKLRAVRVALPAGYKVLLKNNKAGL